MNLFALYGNTIYPIYICEAPPSLLTSQPATCPFAFLAFFAVVELAFCARWLELACRSVVYTVAGANEQECCVYGGWS